MTRCWVLIAALLAATAAHAERPDKVEFSASQCRVLRQMKVDTRAICDKKYPARTAAANKGQRTASADGNGGSSNVGAGVGGAGNGAGGDSGDAGSAGNGSAGSGPGNGNSGGERFKPALPDIRPPPKPPNWLGFVIGKPPGILPTRPAKPPSTNRPGKIPDLGKPGRPNFKPRPGRPGIGKPDRGERGSRRPEILSDLANSLVQAHQGSRR